MSKIVSFLVELITSLISNRKKSQQTPTKSRYHGRNKDLDASINDSIDAELMRDTEHGETPGRSDVDNGDG